MTTTSGHRARGKHRRSDLPALLASLDEAVAELDGRAEAALLERARRLTARAGERLRLSGEHTVVAIAGSTGSGKSTLFNALAGQELSPAGVRRPTTSRAFACVWGAEGAAPLVQWLGVPRRQTEWRHTEEFDDLAGLVLLDLPDHDSTELEHRLEVDRLVEMVDLLVWVVDPQKYADEALHERYLRRLAGHDSVTVVLLNQIDTLNPFAAADCAADLRRLVDLDGLPRSRVLTCSALDGTGLEDVRLLLSGAVQRRRASNDRLVADLETLVDVLAPTVGAEAAVGFGSSDRAQLVDALAGAAGVPIIGKAVERSYLLRAEGQLGWPPVRWVRRLRPDPLRRLHLRTGERREVRELVRSSVPAATPVQQAQVERAVRRVCDSAGENLPRAWQDGLRAAAEIRLADIRDTLDAAVVRTDLGADRAPAWWRAVNAAQWLLTGAAIVGAVWLVLLVVNSWLRLPDPPTPDVAAFPVPTLLLLGGVLLGLAVATAGRALVRGTAALRRRRVEGKLRKSIQAVADGLVLTPVSTELERHERARLALDGARGG